jgi:hypothetical protein
MRKSWPYLLLLVGVMTLIGYISQRSASRRINWQPSYRTDSKIPFGCFLTTRYMDETFSEELAYTDRTAYNALEDSTLTGRNYVIINERFEPSALDVINICRFAANGNTVFISSSTFGFLADTLKFLVDDPLYLHLQDDTTLNAAIAYSNDSVRMNLVNPRLRVSPAPVYDRSFISYAFTKLEKDSVTILGIDRSGYPNFIRKKFGKGEFLLHAMPEAFTNYYAARPANAKYIFGALSYMPDQQTIVDRYYKVGKVVVDDSRKFVLSQPALRLAYFIIIIAGTIALLFGGKRRQRAVPVVQGFRNSTLDFVEQIGALYYRQSDHTNIINKKINYFLESVRSRFYVSTQQLDEQLIEKVTALSGVPHMQVAALFAYIIRVRAGTEHSDAELKELDAAIRDFNKRSKR